MFRTASAAGHRPAAIDLPPTLQPMAITHAAPSTDKRTALLGAFVIYGCMPLAMLAMGRMIPNVPFKPVSTRVEPPVIELPPPTSGGSPAQAPAAIAPALPAAVKSEELPLPPTRPSTDDLGATPRELPTGPQTAGPVGHDNANTSDTGRVGDSRAASKGVGPGTSIGSGPVDVTGTGLQILRQVDPLYPPIARAAHIQGSVVLRMVVDERGYPTKADVIEGPPLLRAEALRAAQQWLFVPARVGGQPVASTFLLTLKFRLI